MRTLKTVILSTTIVLALGSCTWIDNLGDYGAGAAARVVIAACGLSEPQRRKNLDAINGWLAALSTPERATALDCDGSGAPDF